MIEDAIVIEDRSKKLKPKSALSKTNLLKSHREKSVERQKAAAVRQASREQSHGRTLNDIENASPGHKHQGTDGNRQTSI
jgi:hypothetical protein